MLFIKTDKKEYKTSRKRLYHLEREIDNLKISNCDITFTFIGCDIMTFNWGTFYDVGVCMSNISKKEEYQRSAVGRYYYAAFGLVKEYFEEEYHIKVPSNNAHSFLIRD